jgi:hypothetical protein
MSSAKNNTNKSNDSEVEIVYEDEHGNETDEHGNILNEVHEGVVLDNDEPEVEIYRKGEEYVHEEDSKPRSFQDLAKSKEGKAIFKVKDQVDNLINKGKDIKDTFIKEANLVETEEAENLMKEAFSKINDLRTRKTGFLAVADRLLPGPINKFVQNSAMKVEQEVRNNKDIVDVSNDLFDLMKNKQNEVENSAVKFTDIKDQMTTTIKELSEQARELVEVKESEELTDAEKFNAERILTLISSNILTFQENVQNINAAQNMAMQCIMHIDQMLPTIENSMKDSLAINGFLNKISNFKDSFTTIAEVTNQIQDSNSESIHNMIRKTGDFEALLETNVKGIEKRTKAKQQLALEMKDQSTKEKQLGAKLRNAIVDAHDAMSGEEQAPVFLDGDDVGDYYVPERIDLSNQLGHNKSTTAKKKVVRKVVRKVKKDASEEA